MKINSWKSAAVSSFVQAFISFAFCIVYTYSVMFFTEGESFIGKHPTYEMINGIRYDILLTLCGILASLVPIFLLRYDEAKFLLLNIPLSIILYFVVMLLCVMFVIDDNFDLIAYAVTSVPIGSFFGTMIAMLINQFRREN